MIYPPNVNKFLDVSLSWNDMRDSDMFLRAFAVFILLLARPKAGRG
jgi:hypothetical protein